MKAAPWSRRLGRLLALLVLCALALQLVFVARVALLRWLDPASTTMQRSEAWRLVRQAKAPTWRQQWVPVERISPNLWRAVIASEDAGFVHHAGLEWQAIRGAWQRNEQARQGAERRAGRTGQTRPARLIGGSTITQQLTKNLLLSGERTLARKAQEAWLALVMEALLDKRRILEIYLNHVEWGEALFGAQAAARRYHGVDAAALNVAAAADLAVRLPAPKRFERLGTSTYMLKRADTVLARMPLVELP